MNRSYFIPQSPLGPLSPWLDLFPTGPVFYFHSFLCVCETHWVYIQLLAQNSWGVFFNIIFLLMHVKFHPCIQCILVIFFLHYSQLLPDPPHQHLLIPSQFLVLKKKKHWVQFLLSVCFWLWIIRWRVDNWPGDTTLKTDSLSAESHQLPVDPQLELGGSWALPPWWPFDRLDLMEDW